MIEDKISTRSRLWRQTKQEWGVGPHLQTVVLRVCYGGNTDEHRVPLVDSFHLHSNLKTVQRSLPKQRSTLNQHSPRASAVNTGKGLVKYWCEFFLKFTGLKARAGAACVPVSSMYFSQEKLLGCLYSEKHSKDSLESTVWFNSVILH